jgi:DNA-binding PadR family transcriptional regulator
MVDRWLKRTAGVPRGLLRFLVLNLLTGKPMSGSEIVGEIEQETGGKWKPSPGSIYPLLAWLQDKGHTRKSAAGEGGMKRYALTDKGRAFFEDQVRLGQKFLRKLEYLAPMLVGGFELGANRQNLHDVKESGRRLVKTFVDLRVALRDSVTSHDAEEIAEVLDSCAEKLEEIAQRIKGGEPA